MNTELLRGLSNGGLHMFPDTDLPLALIMEEILEWEKKPDSEKDNEKG